MAKPSVYIETTIVSYLTARPSKDIIRRSHELITARWWTDARPRFDLYTSDVVLHEAARGDPAAAAERMKALADLPVLPATPAAMELAQRLAAALALPARANLDAAHVAVAAVNRVQFLLTWNCRHLANATLHPKIEQVCAAAGHVAPRIIIPDLLMEAP